ncbi:MAG: nucleotide pyrophosphohydrolase [Muribaculaceae bacterium]|nr:nucleotide pyrophosphohydrolase [Muribaculaceae bacterium]
MSLSRLQQIVDDWITDIGHGYFSPLTNMAVLTEETGEVARQMSRLYGDQTFKAGETPDLADELADVIWVVTAIANQTGVDLTEAMRRNLVKKTTRDLHRHEHRKTTSETTDNCDRN